MTVDSEGRGTTAGGGGLARTLRRGAVLSAGGLVVVQIVSLVQTLVIARILTPAEVGVFAAGTVLSAFLMTFSEGGMRNALVQRERNVEDAADTVFWATLGAGVLWAALAVAVAPAIARVFDSPLAGLVVVATAGTIILHALTNVPDSLMQRRFDFRQRVIVQPAVAVGFAVSAVAFCAAGFGVWGLVIGSYVSQVVWLVASWSLAGWRPGKGRPSLRLWRELARYGLPLVLGTVVDRARDLLETAAVGGAMDSSALGHYRYGRRLASLPGTAIIEVGSYVLFPAFARIHGDATRLKQAFLRALRVLWGAAAPAGALVVVLGEPLIVLLLGEPWRGAAVMFVALAGSGPGVAMAAVGMETIKGCGRTGLLNWLTGPATVVGIGLLFALLPFGLVGVGLALSITSFGSGLLSLLLARRLADVSLRELRDRLVPPLVAAVVAATAVGLLEHTVSRSDTWGIALGLAVLCGEGLVFLAIYFGLLRLIDPAGLPEADAALRRLRRAGR